MEYMNIEYAILYTEKNLISFILIAVILGKTMGLSRMMAQRNFAISIIAEMVFFVSDTIFVLINEHVLRQGCKELPKRANIARYGGDEFSILFESSGLEECEKLKNGIKDKLAEINKKTEVPFELTVSIGIASSDGSITLKEFIDIADENMYEEKEKNR